MISYGHRGHVVKQQASLGNSPDANAERQLRKRAPVVVPLLQRLLFEQELLELAFRRRQSKVMPLTQRGLLSPRDIEKLCFLCA
jgi:hypothetical protein